MPSGRIINQGEQSRDDIKVTQKRNTEDRCCWKKAVAGKGKKGKNIVETR